MEGESANINAPSKRRTERENNMAYANTTRVAGFGLMERLNSFRADMADRRAKRAVYTQTVNELAAMSDRDLADIGIARGMIETIALEAAYGK